MKPEPTLEIRGTSAAARSVPRRWTAFVAACSVALGCAATSAEDRPAHALAGGVSSEAQSSERWTDPDLSLESIDALRRYAQVGDIDAAVALTSRLLDRYERGGASDELFEATVWINRYYGNDTLAASGLIARVQQRECTHKVLRLHWLCNAAE